MTRNNLAGWKFLAICGLTFVLCGWLGASAPAEDQAAAPAAASSAPAAPAGAKQGETYTEESLLNALEDMGYDVKLAENTSSPIYRVAFSEGQVSGIIQVEISPNKQYLWFVNHAATFDKDEVIPPDVLLGMLESNSQGPQFFESFKYSDGARAVRLTCCIPNHHVTRVHLRTQIKNLGQRVADTQKLWDKAAWASKTDLAKQ